MNPVIVAATAAAFRALSSACSGAMPSSRRLEYTSENVAFKLVNPAVAPDTNCCVPTPPFNGFFETICFAVFIAAFVTSSTDDAAIPGIFLMAARTAPRSAFAMAALNAERAAAYFNPVLAPRAAIWADVAIPPVANEIAS